MCMMLMLLDFAWIIRMHLLAIAQYTNNSYSYNLCSHLISRSTVLLSPSPSLLIPMHVYDPLRARVTFCKTKLWFATIIPAKTLLYSGFPWKALCYTINSFRLYSFHIKEFLLFPNDMVRVMMNIIAKIYSHYDAS